MFYAFINSFIFFFVFFRVPSFSIPHFYTLSSWLKISEFSGPAENRFLCHISSGGAANWLVVTPPHNPPLLPAAAPPSSAPFPWQRHANLWKPLVFLGLFCCSRVLIFAACRAMVVVLVVVVYWCRRRNFGSGIPPNLGEMELYLELVSKLSLFSCGEGC